MSASQPSRDGAYSHALVLLLGTLAALMPLTMDSYLPVMPALQAHFSAGVSEAQITLTVFMAGMACGQLIYGPVSDRYGRRMPLLTGLAGFVITSIACALAPSLALLAPLRFLQGLFLSCAPIIGRAVARDLVAHERAARLLARIQMISALAPVIAPSLGALLLAAFGWRSVLWMAALAGTALLVTVALRLPETAPAQRTSIAPGRILANFARLLRSSAFMAPLALLCMNQIGLFAFLTNASFVVVRAWGHSAISFGLLFSLIMLGQIAGAHYGGRLATRRGIPGALAVGALLSLAGGLSIALLAWTGVAHLAALGGPMFLFMAATGVLFPNAIALGLSPFPALAGSASSLMMFLPILCGALGGTLISIAFDGTARPMASAIGLASLGVFACERLLIRRRR